MESTASEAEPRLTGIAAEDRRLSGGVRRRMLSRLASTGGTGRRQSLPKRLTGSTQNCHPTVTFALYGLSRALDKRRRDQYPNRSRPYETNSPRVVGCGRRAGRVGRRRRRPRPDPDRRFVHRVPLHHRGGREARPGRPVQDAGRRIDRHRRRHQAVLRRRRREHARLHQRLARRSRTASWRPARPTA